MSATVVNITVQTAGAAAAAGAASGPLGAFDAVMSAFFASVGGAPGNGDGGSPFAGEGAAHPGRHNLDVSKLPDHAQPAQVAASASASAGTPAPVDVLAGGLVEATAPEAAVVTPPSDKADTSEGEAAAVASDEAALAVLAALAQPPVPANPAVDTADEPVGGDASASTDGPPASIAPSDLEQEPAATQVGKDEKPTVIPGAHASDTARLHAAPHSAVMRAATAIEAPAEVPAPPVAAAELAAAQPASTSEPPPKSSAGGGKGGDKSGRGQHTAPSVEATPQDAAAPARTEASAPADAAATEKAPKFAAQAADAPRAQPAQPDQPDAGLPTAPAESSARAHASSAATEAAQVRGSPETVASLSAQIVKKLGARSTHFDVQLDPAGLGKVNVRVAINAEGQVSAAMRFDNPQSAAELRSRAGELQRALAQSGFDLSGGLSFDVTQDQGGQGGQQNAFMNNDNQPGHAFRGRAFAAALETAGDAAEAAASGAYGRPGGAPKGVDVRI